MEAEAISTSNPVLENSRTSEIEIQSPSQSQPHGAEQPALPTESPVVASNETKNVSDVITNTVKTEEVSPRKKVAEQEATKGKWKFGLSPENLTNGEIVLGKNEVVRASWNFVSTAMSQTEWFATICTLGVYYVVTRVLLQRRRRYSVMVTDMSVSFKEEMYQSEMFCSKMLLENQVTYPLSSLAYVCTEELSPRLCGLFPESVACEFRFGKYPVDSQVPVTIYRSNLQIFFDPMMFASKYAFQHAFGINFDANPVELVIKIMVAAPLMATPHMWLVWAGFFGLGLLHYMFNGIKAMIIEALSDPSVGPRQAVGKYDGSCFRLESDVSEDSECHFSMRALVEAMVNGLPNRQVKADVSPRIRGKLVRIGAKEKLQQLNNKKKYAAGDNYVLAEGLLFVSPSEKVLDVCATNPRLTFSDYLKVVVTLGSYYFTDIAGHISHRCNTYFTNRRIIRHSLLLSWSGTCDHSRMEFWVNDQLTNMAVVNFRRRCSFRATAKSFGWLAVDMRTEHRDFMSFVFRSLFHPRFSSGKLPGRTFMTRQDWQSTPELQTSVLTAASLTETESLDCAVASPQRLYTYVEYFLHCCCLYSPEASMTSTDECLYMEHYTPSCISSKTRLFIVLPWCDVDGVFWQNFDAQGPTSCAYCGMLSLLCCLCPCIGIFSCFQFCCCNCCSGSPLSYDTYYDDYYGQKGTNIRVCVKGGVTFRLGMAAPKRFFGMQDPVINALVQSIALRSMQNEIPRNHKGYRTLPFQDAGYQGMTEITSATTNSLLQGVHQVSGHINSAVSTGSTSPGPNSSSLQQTMQRSGKQFQNEMNRMQQQVQQFGNNVNGNNNSGKSKSPAAAPTPMAVAEAVASPLGHAPMVEAVVVEAVSVDQPASAEEMKLSGSSMPPSLTPPPPAAPPIMPTNAPSVLPPSPVTLSSSVDFRPVHYKQFAGGSFRSMPKSSNTLVSELRIPVAPEAGNRIFRNLVPGENVIRSWRIENTLLDPWTVVYYIITLGIGFFIKQILHPFRTFTTIIVTQHRVIFQEEVFQQDYFCSTRVMENDVSFKLSDLSYLNVIETGDRWCGCVPGKTGIEVRFGQYRRITENPPHLGSMPSSLTSKEGGIIAISVLKTMQEVYGVKPNGTPVEILHSTVSMTTSAGNILLSLVLSVQFYMYLTKNIFLMLWSSVTRRLTNFFFGGEESSTAGIQLLQGLINGRVHWLTYSTMHGPSLAAEFVGLLSRLQASKVPYLVPSSGITPISGESKIFDIVPNDRNNANSRVNKTHRYGEKGGFCILQRYWNLLRDEKVYDVLPANPYIRWTCENIFYTLATAGLYYIFYLLPITWYRKSYMVSNRRLVRHTLRVGERCWEASGVRYSSLEMWFLAPINSYTVIEKNTRRCGYYFGGCCCTRADGTTCCERDSLEFFTDGTRFGPLIFYVQNKLFMKSLLKVVSGCLKQKVLYLDDRFARSESKTNVESSGSAADHTGMNDVGQSGSFWNAKMIRSVEQSGGEDGLTSEFLLDAADQDPEMRLREEAIHAVVGSTLPVSSWKKLLCCQSDIQCLMTMTNSATYFETSHKRFRMLTCLPWPLVGGMYWSNFQKKSPCFWNNNSKTSTTPVYGYMGSQLHLNIKQMENFSMGISLPQVYISTKDGLQKKSNRSETQKGKVQKSDDVLALVETVSDKLQLPWWSVNDVFDNEEDQ